MTAVLQDASAWLTMHGRYLCHGPMSAAAKRHKCAPHPHARVYTPRPRGFTGISRRSLIRGPRAVQKGEWVTLDLPFEDFQPVFRAKVQRDAPMLAPMDPSAISSAQFMLSKFEYDGVLNPSFSPGLFELPIAELSAYLPHACPPRFVHISSAGVTRPNRPGTTPLPDLIEQI